MSEKPEYRNPWKHIYSLYRDPPQYRYQAIEIKEHENGTLLVKLYGGNRGDGSWMEIVVPREDREELGRAILGSEARDDGK